MKRFDITDNFILWTIIVGVMSCLIIYFLNVSKQPTNELNKEVRMALVAMLHDAITLSIGVLAGRAIGKLNNQK